MDGRSLKDENVHATNLFKGLYQLQGQTVSVSHDPEQRWYYLDHQSTEEVTFIKIWDSKEDVEAKSTCIQPKMQVLKKHRMKLTVVVESAHMLRFHIPAQPRLPHYGRA
jgi:hypothetical protein